MTESQSPRTAPRRPRIGHRTIPSFVLALGMHSLLFIGMAVAVRWKTDAEAPAVAEVWGALPPVMEVAPAPPPPPPPPPEVKREPEPPPVKEPEIVEKQEKKAPPKKEEKKEEKKDEKKEAEKKKLDEQRQQKALEAQRDAIRKEEEARLEKQLGAAPGTAAVSGRGSDPGYEAQVRAKILRELSFAVPDNTSPDVYADVDVGVYPTGEVREVRITKPSGMPAYDQALERAIRAASPLPKRKDGNVGPTIPLRFRPVEMR